MDWYAGNILSVTGEYYGVEKTIEKEFEVFKNKGGTSGGYGASAGSCAHVSPFSLATQDGEPQGLAFSKSGEKMFVVGRINDAVYEYTLNGSYCIGTASFVDSFSVVDSEAAERNPRGIVFSKSGDKMFIVGATDNNKAKVSEYTLTTPWDISTASFVDSLNTRSQEGAASGLAFSKSGDKMFVMGAKTLDAVHEYTLTTPWDISTASFVDSFSVQAQEGDPTGLAFSKSGDKMFITGANGDDVNEYTLTTPWDISTASFVDSFSVASQEISPQDIWFDSSGKTMFIPGQNGDDVNVYKLTTAWDVSTASFTG
jgi:DNA-binding beta-propeller fold protein YncE